MAQAASKGNCYLCGETISKTAFKKHLMEKHNDAAGDAQTCKLLKVEGADEKAYWLYLDIFSALGNLQAQYDWVITDHSMWYGKTVRKRFVNAVNGQDF